MTLLEYIGRKLSSNVDICRTITHQQLFTIVQAFANNCYIPRNPIDYDKIWSDKILPTLLSNENLTQIRPDNATWMQFTLQLAILGHFNKELISRVFSKSYLQTYLSRKDLSVLDLYKILVLYQTVSMRSNADLTGADTKTISDICKRYVTEIPACNIQLNLLTQFGKQMVLTNVRTKHMHIIHTLLKVNKKDGVLQLFTEDIKRDTDGFVALENVPCNDDEML